MNNWMKRNNLMSGRIKRKFVISRASCGMMAVILGFAVLGVGCSTGKKEEKSTEGKGTEQGTIVESQALFEIDKKIKDKYLDESYEEDKATKLELKETTTITKGGTYVLSGEISDGQVIVNSEDDVRLVLAGVNISCSSGPAIMIQNGKTILTLAEGTQNYCEDGSQYKEEKSMAAIFSKVDLCINGSGALNVSGVKEEGIHCKKDLLIVNGDITVNATEDGIKGKKSVTIAGGKLSIEAGDDGIQSNNEAEQEGYVAILGGEIEIQAAADGIKAESILEFDGGEVNIKKSEEGLEAMYVVINDGAVDVVSSDDGVNATDGSGQDFGGMFGGRGQSEMTEDTNVPAIEIHGGTLHVNAGGDGIDSNGKILMSGGTVYVDGPTNNGNGYFDYATGFTVTGGTLIGVGSSGMLELPDSSSTQNVLTVGGASGAAGDKITLLDNDGKEILSYVPEKNYVAATFSSDKLVKGETYKVLFGETEVQTVTIEDTLTEAGVSSMSSGGFGGPGRPGSQGQDGERPSFSDGEMPNFGDGERPSFSDGEIPNFNSQTEV